jgi:16S rRNA (guanine527-N7)-methyltransferase
MDATVIRLEAGAASDRPEAAAGRARPGMGEGTTETRPPERAPGSEGIETALATGLTSLQIDCGRDSIVRLTQYLALLARWNRVYNLSAIREPDRMLSHHLLDSLSVLPHLQRAGDQSGNARMRVLDVGSGAGFPGIPLALVWPELEVRLVEPVGKKAAFLRQCAAELGLQDRLVVHAQPVEHLAPCSPDHIICRAFASLPEFVAAIARQRAPFTRIWAMKGRTPQAEIAALPAPWRVAGLHALVVPGLHAERHLLELTTAELNAPET